MILKCITFLAFGSLEVLDKLFSISKLTLAKMY